MKTIEQRKCIYDVAKEYEWEKWREEIPYISWPSDFMVKAIPPIGGAIVRYWVKDVKKENSWISVYLDCYDELGYMESKAYWEIYPSEDGDCERFLMHETDDLIKAIRRGLSIQ